MSWSSPVITMAMNAPERNCFQKYLGELISSKKNVLEKELSAK